MEGFVYSSKSVFCVLQKPANGQSISRNPGAGQPTKISQSLISSYKQMASNSHTVRVKTFHIILQNGIYRSVSLPSLAVVPFGFERVSFRFVSFCIISTHF
jgi:hypothetical protein